MTGIFNLKKTIPYITAFFVLLSFTGCSSDDAPTANDSGFWDNAKAIDGRSNLFLMHSVAFEGQPYNNLLNFGKNILLVGQGNYNNSMEFSFDVYNPVSDEIEYSLSHLDTHCDHYEVHGNNLWLLDSQTDTVSIYNEKLELINVCDFESTIISSPCDDSETFFSSNFICSSDDEQYSLYSGIDKNTYKYTIYSIDETDDTVIDSLEGQYYSFCDVDGDSFIYCTDYDNNIWNLHSKKSGSTFFSLQNITEANLLGQGSAYVRQQKSDDNGELDSIFSCYQISQNQNVASSFSYDLEEYSSTTDAFVSTNSAYVENDNCVMFLLYTEECNPEILIWKLDSKTEANEELSTYYNEDDLISYMEEKGTYDNGYDDDYGSTVSLIDDSNYDWGELTNVNNKVNQLESDYNLSIYIGPEVPSEIDVYNVEQENDPDTLDSAVDELSKLLDCYPKDFFNELCYGDIKGIRIYLAGDLSGENNGLINDPSGYVSTINQYLVMVLDVNYSWYWGYTVNHEISHMIDQKLDFISTFDEQCIFSEDKWSSFNPDNFKYQNSYDDYENNENYYDHSNYFIDSYGTTFATEDRAELFGTAMDDYLNDINDDSYFEKDSPRYFKMQYYCNCIRESFKSVNKNDTMPWEVMFE